VQFPGRAGVLPSGARSQTAKTIADTGFRADFKQLIQARPEGVFVIKFAGFFSPITT